MARDVARAVKPPADPRVRLCLDAIADAVAEQILRELEVPGRRQEGAAGDGREQRDAEYLHSIGGYEP